MNKPIQIVFAIALATVSVRYAPAQSRTYRSPRDTRGRKYDLYDQESGEFPKKVPHYRKRMVAKPMHTKSIPIESHFYGGFSLGMAKVPWILNGQPQIKFDYTYPTTSTKNTYTGSINQALEDSYYDFNCWVEAGMTRGFFGALIFGGSAHSSRDVFHMELACGKNFSLFHSHLWVSPSISIGGIGSHVTLPQVIDNRTKDVNILGTLFPYKVNSQLSDDINIKLDQTSGLLRLQCTLAPKIKEDFPLRFTLGYNISFSSSLHIRMLSPVKRAEFSWNSAGINMTNPGYKPDQICNYQGVYFQVALFIWSSKYKDGVTETR